MATALESGLHKPLQRRSEETLERIVRATSHLFERKTFNEITVQDIVAAADSSVGSFYARFSDKDALLDYLHERYREQVYAGIARVLDPERLVGQSVEAIVRRVVPVFVRAHREHQGAMRTFHARAAVDAGFRAREEDMNRYISETFAGVLLRQKGAIRHPHPERAIDFAVVSLLGALLQRVFFHGPGRYPMSDEEFGEHLVAGFLAFVQVKPSRGGRRAQRERA
jgi:AcrR family transcriptional regulator